MINARRPLSAEAVPDGTLLTGFNNAYAQAKDRTVPLVRVSRARGRGTVQADLDTAPAWNGMPGLGGFLCRTCERLVEVECGLVSSESSATATYLVPHDPRDEPTARSLAAFLHAALHGDIKPLAFFR
ncbi:hypothetical protein GCM10010446_68810 [Streptomyces enissocaesilis]|uniref:LysR substrate-binding domain-containing protein n=2 Tax=Streptomyces enissocaesilis TaxID=332589 RepID=A0ABN3XQ95_9ACTN